MEQNFKDAWIRKLSNYKRQRYGLSDGNAARCVIGAAREVAVDLGILHSEDTANRNLLNEDELKAIGLSSEAQFYLSTMNDTYGYSISQDKFPLRLINAVKDLPVREKVPLLLDLKAEPVPIELK